MKHRKFMKSILKIGKNKFIYHMEKLPTTFDEAIEVARNKLVEKLKYI